MIGRHLGWIARRALHAATVAHPYRRDVTADLDDAHATAADLHGEDAAGRWYAWQVLRSLGPIARTSEIDLWTALRLTTLAVGGYLIVLGVDRAANSLVSGSMSANHQFTYRVTALGWIITSAVLAVRLVDYGARKFGLVANALLLLLAGVIGVHYLVIGSLSELGFRLAKVITLMLTIAITSALILPRVSDMGARPHTENE